MGKFGGAPFHGQSTRLGEEEPNLGAVLEFCALGVLQGGVKYSDGDKIKASKEERSRISWLILWMIIFTFQQEHALGGSNRKLNLGAFTLLSTFKKASEGRIFGSAIITGEYGR
jgi:hypothetical protein